MEVYVVTRTLISLENGYYDKNTQEPIYKTKHEFFDIQEKIFISCAKAAKYVRELIEKENDIYGGAFNEEDMNKYDVVEIPSTVTKLICRNFTSGQNMEQILEKMRQNTHKVTSVKVHFIEIFGIMKQSYRLQN